VIYAKYIDQSIDNSIIGDRIFGCRHFNVAQQTHGSGNNQNVGRTVVRGWFFEYTLFIR
jgi:hypothetical protein